MNTILKRTLWGSALILSIASCRKSEDYYTNPNTPTQGTASTQLAALEVSTMNTYESDLPRTGGIFIQHGVGVQGASDVQVYNLTENATDNQWNQIYQALYNGDQLRKNFGAKNPWYDGVTQVLMAMNWGVLADYWGDVPYKEALNPFTIYQPKFDAQAVVIDGVIKMLDSAVLKLSQPEADNIDLPGTDDLIFGGSPDSWIKTAYTLKARYLNRYSNKTIYDPAAVLAALDNGISSAAEDCMTKHGDPANEQNQWYAYLNNRAYVVAAEPLVDSMKLRPQDLRLYSYFDSSGFGDVYGSPIAEPDENVCYWGSYLAGSGSKSTPLVTFMEAQFLRAEVYVRQGRLAEAAAALNAGIRESCLLSTGGDYNGADIATYTATDVDLGRVMYEKWIAMFGQTEAYSDYRRTKLPALTPNPNGAINVILQRYPVSQQERNTNPNVISKPISTPVWWALP